MTQTYRTNDPARWGTGQGFNLSPAQVDINFWDLIQRMIAQEQRPDPSAGIAYFEIVGAMMYVHMTDGMVHGPYQLPVAIFRDRGAWTSGIAYVKMDTFSINGGLYVVVWDHVSNPTFDPGANDGAGHAYYQLMVQTPGAALPSGGAVGTVLLKASTVDYVATWGQPNAELVLFVPATGSELTANNVADAIEEAASGGGDAINVSYTPATGSRLEFYNVDNVQDAIDQLDTASVLGRQTIWVPASAMTPHISNGPSVGIVETAFYKNVIKTLDFDSVAVEYAQFEIAMPKSWDRGHLFFKVFWSNASGGGGAGSDVVFAMDAVGMQDGSVFDSINNIGASILTTGGGGNQLWVSDESGFFTASNAFGNNMVLFRIYRNPVDARDNYAQDARLQGVQVFYTVEAGTDD